MHLLNFLQDKHRDLECFFEYCVRQSDAAAADTLPGWEERFEQWRGMHDFRAKYGSHEEDAHAKARILSEQLRTACRDIERTIEPHPIMTLGFTNGCIRVRIPTTHEEMRDPPHLIAWDIVKAASEKNIPTNRIVKALHAHRFYRPSEEPDKHYVYFPNAPHWQS